MSLTRISLSLLVSILACGSGVVSNADENQLSIPALSFRWVERSPGKGLIEAKYKRKNKTYYVHQETIIEAGDIESVTAMRSDGRPAIAVNFNETGAEKLAKATSNVNKKRIALLLDGTIIFAAVVEAPFSDNAIITGNFTREELVKIDKRIDELISGKKPCSVSTSQ